MPAENPYARAAGAYGATAVSTDQRIQEGNILLKAAKKLEDLAARLAAGETVSREEIGEALDFNQKFWHLYIDNAMRENHHLPLDLKNNIATLAVFVFKRTNEILLDTTAEKFKVLVDINRNIAAGLMKGAANAAASMPSAAPPPEGATGATNSVA